MNPFDKNELTLEEAKDALYHIDDEIDEIEDKISDLEDQLDDLNRDKQSIKKKISEGLFEELPDSIKKKFIAWVSSRCSWPVIEAVEKKFDEIPCQPSDLTLSVMKIEWKAFHLKNPF